jgi:hypothetical protein
MNADVPQRVSAVDADLDGAKSRQSTAGVPSRLPDHLRRGIVQIGLSARCAHRLDMLSDMCDWMLIHRMSSREKETRSEVGLVKSRRSGSVRSGVCIAPTIGPNVFVRAGRYSRPPLKSLQASGLLD